MQIHNIKTVAGSKNPYHVYVIDEDGNEKTVLRCASVVEAAAAMERRNALLPKLTCHSCRLQFDRLRTDLEPGETPGTFDCPTCGRKGTVYT